MMLFLYANICLYNPSGISSVLLSADSSCVLACVQVKGAGSHGLALCTSTAPPPNTHTSRCLVRPAAAQQPVQP